jgi:hypothetical protein
MPKAHMRSTHLSLGLQTAVTETCCCRGGGFLRTARRIRSRGHHYRAPRRASAVAPALAPT